MSTVRAYARGYITRELVERTDPVVLRSVLLKLMTGLEERADAELRSAGLAPVETGQPGRFDVRCERHGE